MDQGLEDFGWLVERRARIQQILLRLYECSRAKGISPPGNYSVLWDLLLGAAFSLWRAVFLAESSWAQRADAATIRKHAEAFLAHLIQTNTITFSQELETRHWSYEYYLMDAWYRIRDGNERVPRTGRAEPDVAENVLIWGLLDEEKKWRDGESGRNLWDVAYGALEVLVNRLTMESGGPASQERGKRERRERRSPNTP